MGWRHRHRCALLAALLLAGCRQALPGGPSDVAEAPFGFEVIVPDAQRGAPDAPLPFPADPALLDVEVRAVGPGGEAVAFDGWVRLRIEPGEVERVEASERVGSFVRLRGGRAEGVRVHVSRVFGEARLWAMDVGFVPAPPGEAACADGRDGDGDGRRDWPWDPGCWYANDDDEGAGSHAVGVSAPLWFDFPRLADVQGRQGASPMAGRRVVVEGGSMVVTRITTDGFYVSELDTSGASVPWGHLFVFNYSTPHGLRVCDRIERLSGGVVEFFGFTELGFPAWRSVPWCPEGMRCPVPGGDVLLGEPCPVSEARVLDGAVLGTPDMEPWESALVEVRGARLPTLFGPEPPPAGSNCDLNGDGVVSLAPGPERDCNDNCMGTVSCSEWNQYLEFGQFVVEVDGKAISVVLRDSVPDFDPGAMPGAVLPALRGTLRHFAPLGPQRGYVLQPRCRADLALPGETLPPVSEACIAPRTEGPEQPN